MSRKWAALVVLLAACGGPGVDLPEESDASLSPDGGASAAIDGGGDDGASAAGDASVPSDAGGDDGGAPELDGGAPELDGAPASFDGAPASFDPLLAISGACGVLDTELTDADPHWFQGTSTFPDGFTLADAERLSEGAQTILEEGTAGGSSGYSEALAFEVLHRCEGASLLRTETGIRYSVAAPGSITDMLVEIDGTPIGVSVTRAVTVTGRCTRDDTYDPAVAAELLARKLEGIRESSMLVAPEDAWVKQILFVYADTAEHADVMMSAWSALDASVRADTILYVSVSEAMDGFVYFEDRCR
jgi:hypothetical protein